MPPFGKIHWFPLFELFCATASGIIWVMLPHAGGWPLILAFSPWLVRIIATSSPIRRTHFDLPIVIFLLTAASGLWASYNSEAAWQKFWIIISAALLFYALARQPGDHLWLMAGLLGLLGSFLGVVFLLKQDWLALPADLDIINRIGLWWMAIRPSLPGNPIPPNLAGGLMAMVIPFPITLAIAAWRKRVLTVTALAFFFTVLTGVGLVATSSRGAWLALAVASLSWVLWALSAPSARISKGPRWVVYLLFLLVAGLLGLGVSLAYPGGLLGIADRLPGLPSEASRLELARNTMYLIGDYPFTGGGLEAFPGQYSQYILIIPFFFTSYSHNFYLDVALEQGVFALLSFLAILLGSLWLLINVKESRTINGVVGNNDNNDLMRGAVIAGSMVLLLHGLVDDAIYGIRGTPLLFLLAGLAVVISRDWASKVVITDQATMPADKGLLKEPMWKYALIGGTILVTFLVILTASSYKTILAGWYSDLGAVRMAKVELADFPSDRWKYENNSEVMAPAKALFERSLYLDPNNRAAHDRLGLIAYNQRDFQTAVDQLEKAYRGAQGHKGIRKVLGYSYAWLGDYDRATRLLQNIPEAIQELIAYKEWWITEEREDLAVKAQVMIDRVGSSTQ